MKAREANDSLEAECKIVRPNPPVPAAPQEARAAEPELLYQLMNDAKDLELRTPNLGGRRGVLSDWITQRWVQLTGKSVTLSDYPWLEGPIGDVDLIGSAFFRRLAEKKNLDFVADGPGRGLIDDFSRLSGPACSPNDVDARVVAFYQNTAEFEFDIWSEWCGVFRPFGGALAVIFNRRLQQLNVPLSPLDTKLGITSES